MRAFFETYFPKFVHALLGPRPDFEDAMRLMLAFFISFYLLCHLLKLLGMHLARKHLSWLAQKSLIQAGNGRGWQKRKIGRTTVSEGVHGQRTTRLSVGEWRGITMMVAAADCRAPKELWLQVRPDSGWLLNGLLNIFTLRWKDLRAQQNGAVRFLTGDPVFDAAYRTLSNQPELAGAILTQEIRNKLVALRKSYGKTPMVTVTQGEVQYAIFTSIFTGKYAQRLVEKLDLVCDLAAAAEGPRSKNFPSPAKQFVSP